MRALQLVEPGHRLEERDVATPNPGPGEVLVKVGAAGICRSDVHYRKGHPEAGPLPLTLGHEIAGVVAATGSGVRRAEGDRVCVHYQLSCGDCPYCARGSEQFCPNGAMLGMRRDGGFAEYVLIPERNAFLLPDEISLEHGAVMMCSSATCYHALRKARMTQGESVAIFGVGGLGMSAVQIARAFGAGDVYAVDINPAKLQLAATFGAVPIDATAGDPVEQIRQASGGGVDVALELIGLAATMRQSVDVLAPLGRAIAVGVGAEPVDVSAYRDMIVREAEIIGSADHLAQELPGLLDLARRGALDLSQIVTNRVPLEEEAVNAAMDALEQFGDEVRTVIVP